MALLLAYLTCGVAPSKPDIVTVLHVFSPGSTKTFFPVRALFGATSTGEWTGLAVLITHGSFAQQISWSLGHYSLATITQLEFARAVRCIFAPIRHAANTPTLRTSKARARNHVA